MGHSDASKDRALAIDAQGGDRRSEANAGAREGDEDMEMAAPMGTLENTVPETDERRAALARDPLAGVDGFRVVVGFVFERIFGMRYCPRCPDCECADLLGSDATAACGC